MINTLRALLITCFFSLGLPLNSYGVIHISNCPTEVGNSIKQSLESISLELPRIFNNEFSYRDIIVQDEVGNSFTNKVNFSLGFSRQEILDIYAAINQQDLSVSCQERNDPYCPYGMSAYTPHLEVRNKIVFCDKGTKASSYCDLSTTLFHEIAHVANIPEVPGHNQSSQANYSSDDMIYLFGDAVKNLCEFAN